MQTRIAHRNLDETSPYKCLDGNQKNLTKSYTIEKEIHQNIIDIGLYQKFYVQKLIF